MIRSISSPSIRLSFDLSRNEYENIQDKVVHNEHPHFVGTNLSNPLSILYSYLCFFHFFLFFLSIRLYSSFVHVCLTRPPFLFSSPPRSVLFSLIADSNPIFFLYSNVNRLPKVMDRYVYCTLTDASRRLSLYVCDDSRPPLSLAYYSHLHTVHYRATLAGSLRAGTCKADREFVHHIDIDIVIVRHRDILHGDTLERAATHSNRFLVTFIIMQLNGSLDRLRRMNALSTCFLVVMISMVTSEKNLQ